MQIARYNWPQYAAAALVVGIALAWLGLASGPPWLRAGVGFAALLATWWSVASLVASHWIYDRSSLYRWTWIPARFPSPPRRWLNLHAGLDESSSQLRNMFPECTGTTADFHDPDTMTEPSILRARQERSETDPARRVSFRKLPFADRSFDAVFLLFAAHELRQAESRDAFFREVHRVLAPGGALLLVEHARDAWNFAAFGPGFLHFYPRREWLRLATANHWHLIHERRMTPFVIVLHVQKSP